MPDTLSDEDIGLVPLSDEDIGLKQLAAGELKRQTLEAKIEAQQARAVNALTDLGVGASKAVVRAFSYVDPTGFSQGLMNQYGVEPVHVIPPEKVLPDVRTVSEFTREGLQNLGVNPNVVLPEQYRKPVEEFAAENIAALPEMAPLMTAGVAAPKPVARVFQAQMLRGVPEAAYQAATAPTQEERVKAGLSAGAGLAFPALIEHGIRERPTPIPDIPGSRLEQQRGALPPQPEVAPIERATPEQAAAQAEQMAARFEEKPATEPSILAPEKPEVAPVTEAPAPKLSNRQIASTWNKLVSTAKGDLDELILNWNNGAISEDGTKITFPFGRDRESSVRASKKDFFNWLYSDEPFDPKSFDQNQQWVDLVNRTRENAGLKPKEVAPVEKPVEEPAKVVEAKPVKPLSDEQIGLTVPSSGISPTDKGISNSEKAFRTTPEGQKAMASRGSRIAVLQQLNEAIRKVDPKEAYDRGLINSLPDSQIDGMLESLRQDYNRLIAPKPAEAPVERTAKVEGVREIGPDGFPKDGKPINAGDVFATSSGRKTTPYPKYSLKRTTNLDIIKANQWLIDNAITEAKARGDDYNASIFSNEKAKGLPPASIAGMQEYLFGQQPEVIPKILKSAQTPAEMIGMGGAVPTVESGEVGGLGTPPIIPTAPIPADVPVKAISQIIRDLSKGLNVPIRFGRLTTSKYAGYFKKVPNLIGARRANELPIVAHEVGHKLDSLFNISSDPSLRAELDLLGDPSRLGPGSSWTPKKSLAYKYGEGVAEFIRQWIDDPAKVATTSPNMARYFDALLQKNEDMARVMNQAQENLRLWKTAPPLARLDSSIVQGEGPVKARYGLSNLTRDLVDDLHFLKLATEEAKKTTPLQASQDPYVLARLLRGTYGMADSFIRNGIVDFKTKEVAMGTGLEDILKPVSGRINDFRRFIVAKRAKELMDRGKNTGLQPGDVAEALRVYQTPEFQAVFDKVKAWNDALLKYALDAGMLKPETVEAMREMNKDYVPFHRFFEIGANELNAEQGTGTGRGLNVGTPGSMRRLTGSNRDIVDPLETMVRNAYAIITASEKNAINVALADLADKPNMGKWIERVKTPVDPHKVQMADIRRKLEAMGADVSMIPDEAEFTFFRRAGRTPYGENIIKVVRDGNAEYYRVNGDLYETFHALDYDLAGKFIRLFSQPAQLLRAGVTLTPDFATSNALRDTFSSAVISKYTMFPFYNTARGIFNLLGGDKKLAAEWAASGGKQAIETTYFDAKKIQQFLRHKLTKEMTPSERAKMYIMSPLTALRRFGGLFEEGTRLGQYELAYKKLRSQGVPEGDARRMASYEARDLQDFAKGGANTKPLRMLAAFWNAGLQGNIRLAQAFRERPIGTLAKGLAFITLPKLMEQAINWNNDDYWDRPQWERDLFFLFPFGKDENGHTRFVRVPVPFEVGVIFASFPGRITQWVKENRPEVMGSFPQLMLQQAVPNPTPQWLMTLFEVAAGRQGYSLWRNRPIVPGSVSDKAPELQFTEQNSLTSKKVGKALGLSPAKIDYAIQGTTGGLGKTIVHQGVDRVIQAITGETPTAQNVMPGGRFITTPAGSQSDAVERFYAELQKAREDVSLFKEKKETSGAYRNAKMLEHYAQVFSEWRSQARKSKDPIERQAISLRIAQEAKLALKKIEKSKR